MGLFFQDGVVVCLTPVEIVNKIHQIRDIPFDPKAKSLPSEINDASIYDALDSLEKDNKIYHREKKSTPEELAKNFGLPVYEFGLVETSRADLPKLVPPVIAYPQEPKQVIKSFPAQAKRTY